MSPVMENGDRVAKDAEFGNGEIIDSEIQEKNEKESVQSNSNELKVVSLHETVEEAADAETTTIVVEESVVPEVPNVELVSDILEDGDKAGPDLVKDAQMFEEVIQSADNSQSPDEIFYGENHSDEKKIASEESEKNDVLTVGSNVESISCTVDDEKVDNIDETSGVQSGDGISEGDIRSEGPENGTLYHDISESSVNHGEMRTTEVDIPQEKTVEAMIEVEDTNGVLGSNQQEATVGEIVVLGSSDHQEKPESTFADSKFENRGSQVENQVEESFTSGESGSRHVVHNGDMQNNDVEAVGDSSRGYSESSQPFTESDPVVNESEANLEVSEVERQCSSELILESSGASQELYVQADDEVSRSVAGEPKQEVDVAEDKQSSSESSQQEVRPDNASSSQQLYVPGDDEVSRSVAGEPKQLVDEAEREYASETTQQGIKLNTPSSGHSLASSSTPAYSGVPAIIQEPISHPDKSTNGKGELKSTRDVASSPDKVTPHPSDHRLPEPASQDSERTAKSTAVSSSNNRTLATPIRPAGLGRAAPLSEPASRVAQQPRRNGPTAQAQNQIIEDPINGDAEEYDETREKLQMIRVKFLRLAYRLGQTPHNLVVAQVLYRLGLAEQLQGRSSGRAAPFSFDRASAVAEQLETAGHDPLDFTCTILVLGKSGVGKSATINSIFDEVMFRTDAFRSGTKKVQDIIGTVQGIRVRVIDTPGLLPSWSDQPQNEKILRSVKRFVTKAPPDIVLYLDRLDMQSRDSTDMPLLRTITEIFGPSIWFTAIVVFTHAATAPPEDSDGIATDYDTFVTMRTTIVQQAIRQAAGDMRLMNPVALVENHSACRTNTAGQRVLPNGQVWKPHLLLLSFASKILAEANTLLKLQDNTTHGRPFVPRTRSLPLPFLLSSLLQSRNEVKLPSEQYDDGDDDIDDDLDECSDSEEESEYDQLPPFRTLTKAQLDKLSKTERNAYYDEIEYREKLFMKKQLKEERKQRKMMKKLREASKNMPSDHSDEAEEGTSSASVPVPMPDLALPASFDSDNPTYRYYSLDSSNPWLVRAVMEPNGWDHDIGYDGVNVERLFVVKDKVPISFTGHVSKDKKDSNLQLEVAGSVKHGRGKATSFGLDMQTVGKGLAYTVRGETRFSNHRVNKASAGFSATVLGDVLTGGMKLEDKLNIGKRGQIVVSGGAMYGRGDVALGGTLEATLRDKDHPLGRFLSTLGLSVMDWHGDLAVGCNTQTQIPIGRHSNLIGRLNINNKGSGQFSIRVNSTEQLQIILVGLLPLIQKVISYSQQVQYGQ